MQAGSCWRWFHHRQPDNHTIAPRAAHDKRLVTTVREFVIDLLGRGWTTDRVLHEYDHLTREDVQACLAYASEVLKSERVYMLQA